MTISRSHSQLPKPKDDTRIDRGRISYVCSHNRREVFSRVLEEFERSGIQQKTLAARTGKDESYISRILSAPSNMEIDTLSALIFAMSGGLFDLRIAHPLEGKQAVPSTSAEQGKIHSFVEREDKSVRPALPLETETLAERAA